MMNSARLDSVPMKPVMKNPVMKNPVIRNSGKRRALRAPGGLRSGLSLVEVLVALAISGVLLTSVYSAITMYFHYSHSGQEEIAKNQLARVLLQRIEQDLRSIVYRPDDGTSTTDDASTTGTASTTSGTTAATGQTGATGTGASGTGASGTSTTTTMEIKDPSEAFAGSNSGLFGDMQTIVLHVSRPRLDMLSNVQMSGPVVVSRTSDLKTVSYFVAGNGTSGLQAAAAAHFATQNLSGSGRSSGLARMEGDRLALQLADKSGNVGSLLGQTQMLAPEVSRVNFRYYDGTTWTTKWDSVSYGGLPRAVEINLELTFAAETTGQGRYKKTKQEPPRVYRSVVFLPVSKPLMTGGV